MPSYRAEQVDPSAFLAPGAVVLGDVTIGADSSVWFGAVLRGDTESIRLGQGTNIQDGCVLHADPGFPCLLGSGVTVGHRAIVHGAIIEDGVLIGMGSIIMNGARIGTGSLIGVGAVVTEGTIIPPNSLVLGLPAKIKRPTTDQDQAQIKHAAQHYIALAKQYIAEAPQR